MAHPKIEAFIAMAPGTAMDPDRSYGYQCVDLADYYGEYLFGKPWQEVIGWVVGAKQILDSSSDAYWTRIDNNGDPNQIPQRGDVIVWSGDGLNEWGHVAVVLEADVNGVTVIQQDGFAKPHQFVNGNWFSAKPAHIARLGYTNSGTGYTLGWLRPKLAAAPAPTPPAPAALKEFQRETENDSVAYRESADPKATLVSWLEPNKVYDFEGFVRGVTVTLDGHTSNIWYKGRYTGKYAWSGLFKNKSTAGLPDLTVETPPVALQAPNKRTVGKDAVRLRQGPTTGHSLMILDSVKDGHLKPDHEYEFKGFVTNGEKVGGSTIWFVSKSGGYSHHHGFTNQSTDGLTDLTPKELPAPTPEVPKPEPVVAPTPIPEYSFNKSVSCVTEVLPARVGHFAKDGLPKRPMKIVIHQYDAKEKNVQIDSVVSWFRSPSNDRFTSAHFVIQGPRIVQMVDLVDRAYHAGAGGNDCIGIETYVGPNGTDQHTFNSVVQLIKQLEALYGYTFEVIKHNSVGSTSCGADIDIDAYRNALKAVAAPVAPAPTAPVIAPAPIGSTNDIEEFAAYMHAAIDAFAASRKK